MNQNRFTYAGKAHDVGETKVYGQRAFRKRTLVCRTEHRGRDATYTDYAVFDVVGDACAKLDGVRPGDELEVSFALRGRLWEPGDKPPRWFGSAEVFDVRTTAPRPDQTDEPPVPTEADMADVPF